VLTIAAGDTSASIPIVIYGDRLGEVDEYFSVDLSAPSVGVLDSWHAVGIIVNDEPFVSINSTSGVEGNSGATNLTFTVTLSALSSDDVIVSYATGDSSAQAGSDYKAVADSVTIPAGQWSNTFMVQVNGDRVGEGNESFLVQLTSAIGAVVDYYNTGYGTIIDNEPHFTINSVSITEGNSGTKLLTFTVTLSAAYDQTVTVNYATHDSSATAADNDYITTSGTLTFTVGQTMKTFTVTIRGDKKREGDESFYVLLSGASSNAWIANDFGWATILTDEAPRGGRKNR
jgi:hypothetical protein